MRRLILGLALGFALSSVGCIVISENSLFTADSELAPFDPSFLGDYEVVDDQPAWPNEERFLRVERKAPALDVYLVTEFRVPRPKTKDDPIKPVESYTIEVRLLKCGKSLITEYPLSADGKSLYLFDRIRRTKSGFDISFLNLDYIRKHPDQLQFIDDGGRFGAIRLTSSAAEMKEYLDKYADVSAAWGTPQRYVRRR